MLFELEFNSKDHPEIVATLTPGIYLTCTICWESVEARTKEGYFDYTSKHSWLKCRWTLIKHWVKRMAA